MVATTATTAAIATTAATSTSAAPEAAAAFGIVSVALLLVLLLVKEIAGASSRPLGRRVARVANLATAPLLMTFVLMTVAKVVDVLV